MTRGTAVDVDHSALTRETATLAAKLAPEIAELPIRAAWRRLVALPPVAAMMRDSLQTERPQGSIIAAVAVIEGLGRGGIEPGLCYALTSQLFGIQWPLSNLRALTDDQRAGILDGSIMLCHALTEETGGSDPLSMGTSAEPHTNDTYVLRGRKAYVTAAPVADLALVFARTSPGRHPFALTAFLIPTDTAGIVRSEPFAKRALPAVPMGALDFTDVVVRAEETVTAEGAGLAFLSVTTTWERALLMSYAIGVMHNVLDRATAWVTTRRHFDRPMGASPLTAARIADMAVLAHRVRALVTNIAARLDAGTRPSALTTEAAMVKISCAQDLMEFETLAGQLFGARSVIADSGFAVDLPGALASSIYAGSNDLLRIAIARELSLPVEN
ncbi:acyl-CoA dehydrogenase family protein [Rhodococcoides yunnanense]|uniref:acyl-CoA dehydrogenase family protein n=1 Tax=Rhodococcoides yunnanense TaxID=278209 RepID=UPI0009339F14|nr:acyl-CoA dehydrogenase [Rhodococcus yunnanensis]